MNQFKIIVVILTLSLWNILLDFILISDFMYDVYGGFWKAIVTWVARPFKKLHSNSFCLS